MKPVHPGTAIAVAAHKTIGLATLLAISILLAAPADAAGTNMPWEQPLNQILDSIQGPVAKVMSVIVIILTGLALAFGETSGGFRRLPFVAERR